MVATTRLLVIFVVLSILTQQSWSFVCYNQKNLTTSSTAPLTRQNKACATLIAICNGVVYGADCLGLSSREKCGTTLNFPWPNGPSSCSATYKCCYADLCNTYNVSKANAFHSGIMIPIWFLILTQFIF
ncbi:unnamed protein product [Adineta ricciae]|uniref:Uncharacterized protein n=1 Tax=Adineta ricciae TaxID=249248 RepID=A0A815RRX6_ADIRI|nr:unnamed protein product [Adineta ricciae]